MGEKSLSQLVLGNRNQLLHEPSSTSSRVDVVLQQNNNLNKGDKLCQLKRVLGKNMMNYMLKDKLSLMNLIHVVKMGVILILNCTVVEDVDI